jgi:Zinc carboxypeptidase
MTADPTTARRLRGFLGATALSASAFGVFRPGPVRAAEIPADWLTPAEVAGFRATPSYEETLAFLRRLEQRMPELRLGFYGSSEEGRRLPLVIVSKERSFGARRARALPKPIVLVQNGIHAGEIDGKDACLMLLRDMALGHRPELLDAATLLVLPIYNVDGHERVSRFNRPNQDGPEEGMGFRTNAAGLDLNRDHLKLASEEARSLIALVNAWRPHLHVDNHVNDGFEHAWVITTGWAAAPQLAPSLDDWMRARMPAVLAAVEKAGHRQGPFGFFLEEGDPSRGYLTQGGEPRMSTGYFALRNRPSILVETNPYRPYRERVLATRDFLAALIAEVGNDPRSLLRAVEVAEQRTVELGRPDAAPSEAALAFEPDEPPERVQVPLYERRVDRSQVSGEPVVSYERGRAGTVEVPWLRRTRVARRVSRPRGYVVLAGWPQVEQRLRGHGLRAERLMQPAELDIEAIRVSGPVFAPQTYQGLTRVTRLEVARTPERRRVPAGALWVPADQPDFEVAVQLFEPEAPDSLVSWGLLSSIFEQKEYIEPRVLEGLAAQMLNDRRVAAEWEQALRDEAFAKDAAGRRLWWYRRTPYWDATVGLMPAFRVMKAQSLVTRPWR